MKKLIILITLCAAVGSQNIFVSNPSIQAGSSRMGFASLPDMSGGNLTEKTLVACVNASEVALCLGCVSVLRHSKETKFWGMLRDVGCLAGGGYLLLHAQSNTQAVLGVGLSAVPFLALVRCCRTRELRKATAQNFQANLVEYLQSNTREK
jgi:hypothetical protein